MSGSGDIGGEVSGDEAAWRDLVARFDAPADLATEAVPWPDREGLPDPAAAPIDPAATSDPPAVATADPAAATADPVTAQDQPGGRAAGACVPLDRTRVIRQAGDPRSYSPPEEEDEPYRAAPLPPPAKLDSISKAAWVGVIGGPGYLLVVSLILHWTVSAEAAFVAVAAFIGGFVTLVIKLGDRPRRDDDDDGAVL